LLPPRDATDSPRRARLRPDQPHIDCAEQPLADRYIRRRPQPAGAPRRAPGRPHGPDRAQGRRAARRRRPRQPQRAAHRLGGADVQSGCGRHDRARKRAQRDRLAQVQGVLDPRRHLRLAVRRRGARKVAAAAARIPGQPPPPRLWLPHPGPGRRQARADRSRCRPRTRRLHRRRPATPPHVADQDQAAPRLGPRAPRRHPRHRRSAAPV
ncbi:hypothetical protein IWQ57_005061, partial [Coemansia nantahalensis]